MRNLLELLVFVGLIILGGYAIGSLVIIMWTVSPLIPICLAGIAFLLWVANND